MAFILDSKDIITACADGAIRIWNINSGECVSKVDVHEKTVYRLGLSFDKGYLVSASGDSSIWISDL